LASAAAAEITAKSPPLKADADERLAALASCVEKERALLDFPQRKWVVPHASEDGQPILNVLIVGAGQGGLAIAIALLRDHVDRVLCIDMMPEGQEGPWLSIARMMTLRTPKQLTGPDVGLPSLSFQRWYEAQFGAQAWEDLFQIPRTEWVRYLRWVREVTGVPVQNGTRLDRIVPAGGYLAAEIATASGTKRLLARKIVLATGMEGGGEWYAPEIMHAVPRRLWAHSSEPIDFSALRGKAVAVLGAAASAMDNAAMALERGARSVDQYCRRSQMQSIQPYKWAAFPGFTRHIGEMDDRWRWRFLTYFLDLREPFTQDAWQRVSRFPNYRMVIGEPWQSIAVEGEALLIRTSKGLTHADFIICGTGVTVDHRLRPELGAFAHNIATWQDKFQPPAGEENPRLGLFPYLSPSFSYVEREAGATPELANVHCFNFASTLSFGPSGAAIRPMKYLVPKFARALTRDLFRADIEQHWADFRAYRGPEFDDFPF
jgi:cation diffusion facilitator CzcD-associated flavoprotein CzcO